MVMNMPIILELGTLGHILVTACGPASSLGISLSPKLFPNYYSQQERREEERRKGAQGLTVRPLGSTG